MTVELVKVSPVTDPGITRVRTPTGMRYVMPDGSAPDGATLKRINALVLPPAWTDVWICADPRGRIQAVGVDGLGRHQYRYHPAWRAGQQEHKFDRIVHLASALPAARARVTCDLRQGADGHARMLAAAFRFLDDAAPRVGSIAYREKYGSRGLTTLQERDAAVEGHRVLLRFPAKSHKIDQMHMLDADLAAVVADLMTGNAQQRLLRYQAAGRLHHLHEGEVNDYIRQVTGDHFTAKDFRTLRGTVVAAKTLAQAGLAATQRARHAAEVKAAKAASKALQNTRGRALCLHRPPRVPGVRARAAAYLSVSPDTALRRLVRE